MTSPPPSPGLCRFPRDAAERSPSCGADRYRGADDIGDRGEQLGFAGQVRVAVREMIHVRVVTGDSLRDASTRSRGSQGTELRITYFSHEKASRRSQSWRGYTF